MEFADHADCPSGLGHHVKLMSTVCVTTADRSHRHLPHRRATPYLPQPLVFVR